MIDEVLTNRTTEAIKLIAQIPKLRPLKNKVIIIILFLQIATVTYPTRRRNRRLIIIMT